MVYLPQPLMPTPLNYRIKVLACPGLSCIGMQPAIRVLPISLVPDFKDKEQPRFLSIFHVADTAAKGSSITNSTPIANDCGHTAGQRAAR